MRTCVSAAAVLVLPCAAMAQDHAYTTSYPASTTMSQIYYHAGQQVFTPDGLPAWTPVYHDSSGDGGLGNFTGGPLPAPGPPPAPIAPPSFAFDALHTLSPGGFLASGLRINYYQYAHGDQGGATSVKIHFYENNAQDSILPTTIGGSAQQLGEITVANLPTAEGAYELEVYAFGMSITSPHLWIGLEFTDGFALPLLGANAPNFAIGTSSNMIGWDVNLPGFGPGIYDLDNGATWADLGLSVHIPGPAGAAALGAAGLVLLRRRR